MYFIDYADECNNVGQNGYQEYMVWLFIFFGKG